MTRRQVRDVMTRDPVTVRTGTPYRQIVDLLARREVSALPVLDGAGMVVGVVSEADLLHKIEFSEQDTGPRLFAWGRHRTARAKAASGTAADLMSAPPYVIGPDASIVTAAKLMDTMGVKRVPVVTGAGTLVGIVSRRDLLGVFLRSDTDLRTEIEEDVVRRILLTTPEQVRVRVDDGVVTLTGKLASSGLVPITERLIREVDGVVNVEVSGLGYHTYDNALRRSPGLADSE